MSGATPAAAQSSQHVRFLVTADPQYFSDDSLPGTFPIKERADDTLRKVVERMAAEGDIRGIVIAGDLTQFTRHREYAWFRGTRPFDFWNITSSLEKAAEHYGFGPVIWQRIYEGLGNHDLDPGVRGGSACGNAAFSAAFEAPCPDRRAILGDVKRFRFHTNDDCSFDLKFHDEPDHVPNDNPAPCPHYSWTWEGIHFVQLNVFPGFGNDRRPEGGPPPLESLRWLQDNLATHVGNSGRPVVLVHHYDTGEEYPWWPYADKLDFWDVIVNYNVALLLTGHSEPGSGGLWYWPSEDTHLVQPKFRSTAPANPKSCTRRVRDPELKASGSRQDGWAEEPGLAPCIAGVIAGSAKGREGSTWFDDTYRNQTPGLYLDVRIDPATGQIEIKRFRVEPQLDGQGNFTIDDFGHRMLGAIQEEEIDVSFKTSHVHAPPQLSLLAKSPSGRSLPLTEEAIVPEGSRISWQVSGTARPLEWSYALFRVESGFPLFIDAAITSFFSPHCRAGDGDPLPACPGAVRQPLARGDYVLSFEFADAVGQRFGLGAEGSLGMRFSVGPAVSIDDVEVTEADATSREARFTVSLAEPVDRDVSVDFATEDDTAKAPGDYTAASGRVTFAPGETEHHVTVPITNDVSAEDTERFFVRLSNPGTAKIAKERGRATIVDDPEPSLSVSDPNVTEADAHAVQATFEVRLSEANPEPVSVDVATQDMSAGAPADYTPVSRTLRFDPQEVEKTVTVVVAGDVLDEGVEQLALVLFGVRNATVAKGRGIATVEDDPEPAVSVTDTGVTEGDGQRTPASFDVTLTEANPEPVSVRVATGPLTAVAPEDYETTQATLEFAPGETRETVSVPVVGDIVDEPTETFAVRLAEVVNARLGVAQASGTIVDDDRNAAFTCRSAALRLGATEPAGAVANSPGDPCRDDGGPPTTLSANTGLAGAGMAAGEQRTQLTPDDQTLAPAPGDTAGATALVHSARVQIGPFTTVDASGLQAQASATCTATGAAPQLSARGATGQVLLAGSMARVTYRTDPLDIPVAGGVLHLNHTTTTGGSIVRRALWFESHSPLLQDVVVGEARAGWRGTGAHPEGHPCTD